MNAFDTSGPSTLLSKRELANAQKPKRLNTPGQRYFESVPTRFCTAIPSKAAADKTNRIRGRV